MSLLRIVVITWLGFGLAWPAANSASISGSVQDDSGNVLAGATVEIHRIRESTRDRFGHVTSEGLAFSAATQTGADGGFRLSGVPAGGHFICAYPAVSGYLSNCEWNTIAQRTEIADGAQLTNRSLVLRKGTIVQIVADDPSGLVKPPSGLVAKPSGHYFFPSVKNAEGYFSSARFTGDTGSQHTYSVTIPKNVTVELFFDSDISVADSAGSRLGTRVPSGVAVKGGSDTATVSVSLK
jgi:hypothetical protein